VREIQRRRRELAASRRARLGPPAVVVVALAAVALLAACGGVTAPDLFIVQRSGSGAGAKLTLLVNEEGRVSCNGVASASGRKLKLGDAQLVEARAIQEDLREPASKHTSLAPGSRSVLSYRMRDENGSVSFSDDSAGQPQVFRRLALFVLQTAQRVCHLPE
jgi:hypothetical protein